MKLTRRELALAAVAPAVVRAAPQAGGENAKPAAEDAQKRTAEIRKFKVPPETDPAFSFRAQ